MTLFGLARLLFWLLFKILGEFFPDHLVTLVVHNRSNLLLRIFFENTRTLKLFTIDTNLRLFTKVFKTSEDSSASLGLQRVNSKPIILNNVLRHFVVMCDASIIF